MKLQIDDLGFVSINVEDWDINLPFPRLTLTTDYSTWITYISRKAVPAGTPITDIKYWKPIGRLRSDLVFDYDKFKQEVIAKLGVFGSLINALAKRIDDLENQMQSFLATASGGEAFSTMYGNSNVMGVTQKTLTETINGLYQLIFDTLGIEVGDVQISITPDSFFSNEAAVVNIAATADYGLFDFVKVYFDGEKVIEETSVATFSEDRTISGTTTIKVEAQVLGKLYTYEKTVTMASDFFIGAGATYEDVYDPQYARPYDGDPTGSYTVEVAEGQRIVIILPTSDVSKIEQIEMNDFNIPMDTTTFGIYTAYTSLNTYQAGTYTIDINY